tara:strand:- start:1495 stop:1653 length:159 start_codon:yes stop_codon:yes gene_type:complete
MRRNLLHINFPEGVKQLYINGKRYTREEFIKAKNLEKRRGKKGRFICSKTDF